jgi:hypothetical protein
MSDLTKLRREMRQLQRDVAEFQRQFSAGQTEFKAHLEENHARHLQTERLLDEHHRAMGEFERAKKERLKRQVLTPQRTEKQ